MNRKVKAFKQTVFLSEQCVVYNKCSKCCIWPWRRSTFDFATNLLPCRWYVIRNQPRNSRFQVCRVTTVLWTTQLVM